MNRPALLVTVLAFVVSTLACAEPAAPDASSSDELVLWTSGEITAARASNDPARIARILGAVLRDRIRGRAARLDAAQRLLEGISVTDLETLRASYIQRYGEDPEITIRSDGLFQHVVRLPRDQESELLELLNRPTMDADAAALYEMFTRPAPLTLEDRAHYFAMLPSMGLWDAPTRAAAGDRGLDAFEREHLRSALGRLAASTDLDDVLQAVERRLPMPEHREHDRARAIAVVVSSHGAQWQELMGWAEGMVAQGYHLQIFTPDGRPAAFQRDSLNVSTKTAPLGFGCPSRMDPAGPTGRVARELLASTLPSTAFVASEFGALYLAGGLGFNEDVAVAVADDASSTGTRLTAHAGVATMVQAAFADQLPIVALCHGPTLFAAVSVATGDGSSIPLARGVATASLPPFESYASFTARKERQFTFDVNTHQVLKAAGARTDVAADIASMSRVVSSQQGAVDVVSGPGPQAAESLVQPTIEALRRRFAE